MTEPDTDDAILRRLDQLEKRLDVLWARLERIERGRGLAPEEPPRKPPEPARATFLMRPPKTTEPVGPSPVKPPAWPPTEARPPRPASRERPFYEKRIGLEFSVDWKGLLKKLNLLPPTGETDLEIHVGTWWATRVGVLLAVLSVVFFGIWVSQWTTPLMKFLELLAASFGVCLVGLWFERKFEQFGRVIFAGGLALLFFTMFAGYGIPNVKVIHDATFATTLQFGAVILMVVAALWKESRLIATMAVFLGYVTCLFSFWVGMTDAPLVAALVLGIGASFFYLVKRWPQPIQASVPLTYLLYAFFSVFFWMQEGKAPGFARTLGYLLAYLVLFWGADYVALLRNTLMGERERRLVQLCNTTGALLLGYLVTSRLYPDRLSTFYFVFGVFMLAGSVMYYLARRSDLVTQTYFVKGATLFTLGVMTEFGARTRWVTLAIQSFLLLLSARRTRLKVVEIAMALVWVASFAFFVHFNSQLAEPQRLWSGNGITSLLYLLFSTCLFSLQAKWLSVQRAGMAPIEQQVERLPGTISGRDSLGIIYAVLLSFVGFVVARKYFSVAFAPTTGVAVAALIGSVALAGRHWIPCIPAGVLLLLSHVNLWRLRVGEEISLGHVWLNAAIVVPATIAVVALLYQQSKRSTKPVQKGSEIAEAVLHGLWMASLVAVYHKTFGVENYFLMAVVTSIVVAAASERYRFHVLREFAVLPMILSAFGYIAIFFGLISVMKESGDDLSLWIGTFAALGLACRYASFDELEEGFRIVRWRTSYQWITTGLATLLGWLTLDEAFNNEGFMLAVGIGAVVVACLSRWPGLRPALFCGIFYLLIAHLRFYSLIVTSSAQGSAVTAPSSDLFTWSAERTTDLVFLWASIAVGALTVVYAAACPRLREDLSTRLRVALQAVPSGAALLLLFVLFLSRADALANYVTALWGISSIVVFLAGLAFRSKPLRIVSLLGLAVCIPRVFVVDIHSMLYRIFACGVLAGVILAISLLYYKYRDIIQRFDEGGT